MTAQAPLRRVLIANRGAIADRIVRACAALGIESVCVYSDADRDAPWLRAATVAVPLGGVRPQDSYLDADRLLAALADSGADALHPGYGFLAEDPSFARAVEAQGAVFVGPTPALIEQLGDKVAARHTLADAGLPVFPASEPLTDLAAAQRAAAAIGYPLLLKPVAGGGGIGMARVEDPAALEHAFERAVALSRAAFADGRVYLETLVTEARHIELQLLGDGAGGVVVLHERDCSAQRRHQKLIEQAPAPGVPRAAIEALAQQARAAFSALGYRNAGTLETLWHPERGFGLLEVNTRIQVEHAVTEAVTGTDLVALQLQLAGGARLSSLLPQVPALRGHAIEARLYAEDWRAGHAATGRLTTFAMPRMTHVRVETGYAAGSTVTPWYDPLLAKIIAWAPTRELALGRLAVALKAVRVEGVATNRSLLRALVAHPRLRTGTLRTDTDLAALVSQAGGAQA